MSTHRRTPRPLGEARRRRSGRPLGLVIAVLALAGCGVFPTTGENNPPMSHVFFQNDTDGPIALVLTGDEQPLSAAFEREPRRLLSLHEPGERWLVGNTNLGWIDDTETVFCFDNERIWFVALRDGADPERAVDVDDVDVVERLDEPCFEHRSTHLVTRG